MNKYLFVLSPPYSGSTVLWGLLATSPETSTHPGEGQMVDGVKHIMRDRPWDPQRLFPWPLIKERWEQVWDMSMPILVEKSPPAIVRAFEIEKVFSPCYFIAMMRDPYAFCEGHRRRGRGDIRESAQAWASHAAHQVRNIQGLKNITYFKYEDFATDSKTVKTQILNFMPELKDIDITESFNARSIRGRGDLPIRNFNQEKIDRLSAQDINIITAVLRSHAHLMSFFGYEYLTPRLGHSVRHLKAIGVPSVLTKAKDTTKKAWARVINGRHHAGREP